MRHVLLISVIVVFFSRSNDSPIPSHGLVWTFDSTPKLLFEFHHARFIHTFIKADSSATPYYAVQPAPKPQPLQSMVTQTYHQDYSQNFNVPNQ
jgi:hypothetical protein